MRHLSTLLAFLLVGWPLLAAEKVIQFSGAKLNEAPAGFRSVLGGVGQPGEWKVIQDEIPLTGVLAPFTRNAPGTTKHAVLAQVSRDRTDERFPMLVYEEETFGDFTLTARFKLVEGVEEQMAGLAFRWQDEKNYYYVRASALGGSFTFFPVVNGVRGKAVGGKVEIPKDVWHEMTIECRGTRIRALFNGKEVFPSLDDTLFNSGKIAFWTKSDSVSYFGETRITYKPKETLAQSLVRDALKKYPRLQGLQILAAAPTNETQLVVVASKEPRDLGQLAPKGTSDVMAGKGFFYGKTSESVMVILPLRDWNGETVAAVKVEMNTFTGQTEKNAVSRAMPILKDMAARVQSARDLVQ